MIDGMSRETWQKTNEDEIVYRNIGFLHIQKLKKTFNFKTKKVRTVYQLEGFDTIIEEDNFADYKLRPSIDEAKRRITKNQ